MNNHYRKISNLFFLFFFLFTLSNCKKDDTIVDPILGKWKITGDYFTPYGQSTYPNYISNDPSSKSYYVVFENNGKISFPVVPTYRQSIGPFFMDGSVTYNYTYKDGKLGLFLSGPLKYTVTISGNTMTWDYEDSTARIKYIFEK